MPIYEFRCNACGHRFEKLCPMGENGANIDCPKCKTGRPHRVMSSFSAKSTGDAGFSGPAAAGGGGCAGCSSSNCGSCGH